MYYNRLLIELRKQQDEAVEGLDDNLIIERIKRIQYLVYNFIYMIIRKVLLIAGYLVKMDKIDNNDKEFFIVLVTGLKTSGMKQSNIESFDGDLFAHLQDGHETISKLEHKINFFCVIWRCSNQHTNSFTIQMTWEF